MSRLKRLGVVIGLLFLTSCSNDKCKKIHIKTFSICVPTSWEFSEEPGIDSYISYFVTSANDTVRLDYGFYSDELTDDGRKQIVVPERLRKELIAEGRDMSRYVFVPKDGDELSIIRKLTTQEFDTVVIDNRRAKITTPKETGKGITGVHFDSLDFALEMPIKLTIYGKDLSGDTQNEVLRAIQTIQFKK